MKQLLYYLILGSRGGYVRGEIINSLMKKPKNANQLSKSLNYDYKTIQHHIDVLLENKMLEKVGKYGGLYFISVLLKDNIAEFNTLWKDKGENI